VKPVLLITGTTGNQRGAAVRAVLKSGRDRWGSRARDGWGSPLTSPRFGRWANAEHQVRLKEA
jgi:hypothetical protein